MFKAHSWCHSWEVHYESAKVQSRRTASFTGLTTYNCKLNCFGALPCRMNAPSFFTPTPNVITCRRQMLVQHYRVCALALVNTQHTCDFSARLRECTAQEYQHLWLHEQMHERMSSFLKIARTSGKPRSCQPLNTTRCTTTQAKCNEVTTSRQRANLPTMRERDYVVDICTTPWDLNVHVYIIINKLYYQKRLNI